MSNPTIEDALRRNGLWGERITDVLFAVTFHGPLRSADGTLVVHRADPELAAFLQRHIDHLSVNAHAAIGWKLNKIVRLIAGDPEEES